MSRGGEPIDSVRRRAEDYEFPNYAPGAFAAQCRAAHLPTGAGYEQMLSHQYQKIMPNIQFAELPTHSPPQPMPAPATPSDPSGSVPNSIPISPVMPMPAPAVAAPNVLDDCVWSPRPALLVTRYEYANLYHSMSDFYNTYQAHWQFNLSTPATDGSGTLLPPYVIFLDGHSAGALDEVWSHMFGGSHGVLYVKHMGESKEFGGSGSGSAAPQRICFERAVFVPPGYQSAVGIVSMTERFQRCQRHPLLRDFVSHFLRSFDVGQQNAAVDGQRVPDAFGNSVSLRESDDRSSSSSGSSHAPSPSSGSNSEAREHPLIALVLRRDYMAHPRLERPLAQRKISNELQLMHALRDSFPRCRVVAFDFALLTVQQQLLVVHRAHVLAGVHGAALTYTLLQRDSYGSGSKTPLPITAPSIEPPGDEGSVLLEIMPPEYSARPHFQFCPHGLAVAT